MVITIDPTCCRATVACDGVTRYQFILPDTIIVTANGGYMVRDNHTTWSIPSNEAPDYDADIILLQAAICACTTGAAAIVPSNGGCSDPIWVAEYRPAWCWNGVTVFKDDATCLDGNHWYNENGTEVFPGGGDSLTYGACPIQLSPLNSSSVAYEDSRVIKASPGTLYGITGYNSLASAQFIQLHDTVAVPADTAVPVVMFLVPASSNFSFDAGRFGRVFSTGISINNSTTAPTKTIGAANCFFDAQYI
jgi:hypothetical protein